MLQHQEKKNDRKSTRTSVNTLFTLISNDEKRTVYNLSNDMFQNSLEKKVVGLCNDQIATEYAKAIDAKCLYECSKMSVYNTDYKRN